MTTKRDFTIHCNSENSVLIVWPEKICAQQHQTINDYQQQIKAKLSHFVIETVSSYNSLMVYYRFDLMSSGEFTDKLQMLWQHGSPQKKAIDIQDKDQGTTIEIPVYYGVDAGWDLPELSESLAMPIEKIVSHLTKIFQNHLILLVMTSNPVRIF